MVLPPRLSVRLEIGSATMGFSYPTRELGDGRLGHDVDVGDGILDQRKDVSDGEPPIQGPGVLSCRRRTRLVLGKEAQIGLEAEFLVRGGASTRFR